MNAEEQHAPDAAAPVTAPYERRQSGLVQFALKGVIAAVIVSAAAIFIVNSITDNIRTQFSGLSGKAFWSKVERELDRAADSQHDLPPEQKQKLIKDIRIIIARWRPIIDAINTDVHEPPPPAKAD